MKEPKIFKKFNYTFLRTNRVKWLAKKINKLNGETILDIGCQESLLKKYINKNFLYTGIDIIKNKDYIIKGDIEKSNIKEKYDIVVCSEVLDHLKDPVATINKIKNIAKKYILISIPHDPQYILSRMLIPCREHYWVISPNVLNIHLGKPFKKYFHNFKRHYLAIWKIKTKK